MKRALLIATLLLASCSSNKSTDAPAQSPGEKPKPTGPITTKVTAFDVNRENLNVDRISMRDGNFSPDGNRDHVFDATVDGPADALFIVTVTDKGEPITGFRADTVQGGEELPQELAAAGRVDVGKLTPWIAIAENNKFINQDNGKLYPLSEGPHVLKMYVPNTGTLLAGAHLRLYARHPSGVLVGGPIVSY